MKGKERKGREGCGDGMLEVWEITEDRYDV